MQTRKKSRVRKGVRLLKPRNFWAKFDRAKSWGWDQVANNPRFPKPVYLNGQPFFIDEEGDEFISSEAERSRNAGGAR